MTTEINVRVRTYCETQGTQCSVEYMYMYMYMYERIYVYVQLVHFAVEQKQTQLQ